MHSADRIHAITEKEQYDVLYKLLLFSKCVPICAAHNVSSLQDCATEQTLLSCHDAHKKLTTGIKSDVNVQSITLGVCVI